MQLNEKYRPTTFSQVVGQEKVVKSIELLRSRGGLGGRAFLLIGQSGTGKTTIGRLIAQEVADVGATEEVDAESLTPARILELERRASGKVLWGRGGWAVICNECHGLSAAAIRQLLVTLERIPSHVVWIFTTTNDGAENLFDKRIDASPLTSRCVEFKLSRQGLTAAFARRAQEIAVAEGLDGQPIKAYERLLKDSRNNLRTALSAIERGAMLVSDSTDE